MSSTSSEVANGLFNVIADTVAQNGLLKFEIKEFAEINRVESYCLSGFVIKAQNCHTIIIDYLRATPENNALLLETVGQMCAVSQCLKQLTVRASFTTAEEGDAFMTSLAEGDLATLEQLDLSGGKFGDGNFWFDGRDECVELLLTFIARQPLLRELNLNMCRLTPSQQEQVRAALADRECAITTMS